MMIRRTLEQEFKDGRGEWVARETVFCCARHESAEWWYSWKERNKDKRSELRIFNFFSCPFMMGHDVRMGRGTKVFSSPWLRHPLSILFFYSSPPDVADVMFESGIHIRMGIMWMMMFMRGKTTAGWEEKPFSQTRPASKFFTFFKSHPQNSCFLQPLMTLTVSIPTPVLSPLLFKTLQKQTSVPHKKMSSWWAKQTFLCFKWVRIEFRMGELLLGI